MQVNSVYGMTIDLNVLNFICQINQNCTRQMSRCLLINRKRNLCVTFHKVFKVNCQFRSYDAFMTPLYNFLCFPPSIHFNVSLHHATSTCGANAPPFFIPSNPHGDLLCAMPPRIHRLKEKWKKTTCKNIYDKTTEREFWLCVFPLITGVWNTQTISNAWSEIFGRNFANAMQIFSTRSHKVRGKWAIDAEREKETGAGGPNGERAFNEFISTNVLILLMLIKMLRYKMPSGGSYKVHVSIVGITFVEKMGFILVRYVVLIFLSFTSHSCCYCCCCYVFGFLMPKQNYRCV